jgi:hypothetical protein
MDALLIILIPLCVVVILALIKATLGTRKPRPRSCEDLTKLHTRLQIIDPRLRRTRVYEDIKSYTINKENIYICARTEEGKLYDRNTLTYVLLHEYAHVLCPDTEDHSEQFKRIFDVLLSRATKLGLFNPDIPLTKQYCGYE